MKTKIFSIIILTAITLNGMSQPSERKTVIRKDNKGVVQSIEYSNVDNSVSIPKSADEFFKNVLNIQTADKFEKMPHRSNREGYVHEHFVQFYNGVKVDNAGYNFHYRNGEMFFAHGKYVKIDGLNTRSAITAENAKTAFAEYKNISNDLVSRYLVNLMIKEIPFSNDTFPMLVYRIRLIADHPDNTEVGFVDAQNGKILFTEPALINVPAVGTFATRYSGSQQAHTDRISSSYILKNDTRGAIIHTRNLNGIPDLAYRVELIDNDNNWTTAEHGPSNNDMALDVHWALQQIYDRLFNVHGRNSFDDNGHQIDAYIKYYNEWDNAAWYPDEKALLFGEGFYIFHPLVSVDVVAHEYGHGISFFQIGWSNNEYNEGMSDIWGSIMKYRITPSQQTWLIGSQIMLNPSYTCLRNLQNTNDPGADTKMANTYGSTQYNSASNIYIRSGVFSHWFYLLVNGGSGVNNVGNSYYVDGIGMDIAEELIVSTVFNNFLRYTSSYAQLRTAFVQVANILDGCLDGNITHQVENAWYAVGVGSQPCFSNFSNKSVTSSRTINGCNPLQVENVTVSNGAKLTIISSGEVTFRNFDVQSGSSYEIIRL